MKIGIPKEIKDGECRAALTPAGVRTLREGGHSVEVEKGTGNLAGFPDSEYRNAGARVAGSAAKIWLDSDLILKVKEPLPQEFKWLEKDKILLSYLHLAANPRLTRELMKSGTTAIAAETVRDSAGRFPLLEPMSEIAGRMAAIVGAYYLSTPRGGRGVLVSGLPGVMPAHFAVIGGGTVGENAAKIASGMGAQVTILDKRQDRLRLLDEILPKNVSTLLSTSANIEEAIGAADVIIGSVLIPGARAPRLITRKMLKKMQRGCILVDVCIDQGGISETSRPTTHSRPTYVVDGVVHYCVSNMPGAYGRTATLAFTNAMTPYVLKLASGGLAKVFKEDPGFADGLSVHQGKLTYRAVAESEGLPYVPWERAV